MKNTLLSLAVLLSVSVCNGSSRLQAVTVPAGAAIRVTTLDPIDLNSARPGARFRGALADSVKSRDGTVLIPRGASVKLRAVSVARSGRMRRGPNRIDLKVDSITFNGETYPIISTITKSRGDRKGSGTLRRTGIGAGAGALIGGIAGGGTAAEAPGAGNLTIPSDTLLSFEFQSALRVK